MAWEAGRERTLSTCQWSCQGRFSQIIYENRNHHRDAGRPFLTLKRPLYDPLKREMQSISETVKLIPDMTLSDNEAKVYDLIGHIYPSKLALSGHIFMNHMNDIKSGKAVLTVTCSAREGAHLVHETYKYGSYNSCRIYSLYLLIRRKIRSDGKCGAFVIWSREEESKLQKCN